MSFRKPIIYISIALFLLLLLFEFNKMNQNVISKISQQQIREIQSIDGKKGEQPVVEDPYETIVIKSRSTCECRKNKFLVIHKHKQHSVVYMSTEDNDKELNYLYSLKNKELDEAVFTCDLFNSLRRGKAQKVISYSLYNKYTPFFYDKLKVNTVQITKVYPEWRIRVYYDDSIDKSIICQIECQKDEKGMIMDVADFCHIKNIELKFEAVNSNNENEKSKSIFNGDYIHAMVWRWFPLGDTFIDVFSSRDMDSFLLQREVDSVNVWLKSDKVGHIMRGIKIFFS